jgi:hypothetical protein
MFQQYGSRAATHKSAGSTPIAIIGLSRSILHEERKCAVELCRPWYSCIEPFWRHEFDRPQLALLAQFPAAHEIQGSRAVDADSSNSLQLAPH